MNTLVEIRRWTRPILERHPELVLLGRNIVLPPVDHFVRGIFVDRTSVRQLTCIHCYLAPMFEMGRGFSFMWNRVLSVPPTDSPEFQASFEQALEAAIQSALPTIRSIEDFVEQTNNAIPQYFGDVSLSRYHGRYGRALAALGRLDEAEPLLVQDLANDPIAQRAANPHLPERLFDITPDALERHSYHTSLLALVRARDPQGIGALLRACEKQQAGRWKVEHLWQPTPFPVELP